MSIEVTNKVQTFFERYKLREFSKGQILLLSGDKASYVYYIISGSVKLYDVSPKGDEVILNIFKPFSFFPMSLVVNPGPSPYIYEAETSVQVWQAPTSDVLTFLRDNPDVLINLLSRVYRGMDGLLGRMNQLMAGTARSRLMYELVVEGRRYGQSVGTRGCMLDVTEKDVAARAGLSRETVSRELHKLKLERLVTMQGNKIVIQNIDALEDRLEKNI